MRVELTTTQHTPETVVVALRTQQASSIVLLRSSLFETNGARFSFVTANPFLTFRSFGSRCEVRGARTEIQFGNPWRLLDQLTGRYELLDEPDVPFPLGGCFGFWGYDLKNFVEPKLSSRAVDDLELPDCHVGFYDSLVVFDHHLDTCTIISTGLQEDGARCERRAREQCEFWHELLASKAAPEQSASLWHIEIRSNVTPAEFMRGVQRAQQYIQHGDIYQVNLSHRLTCTRAAGGWELFRRLQDVSPAPHSAYLDCEDFEIASSSPELFLRLSGAHVCTRPIKGTRPRSADPTRDAQFTYELKTSAKETAELVMITDLLRNDLGRFCAYGSVVVPELLKLERYAQVQHLVSTVEGTLAPGVTHFQAFASAFPGGSITGAPKFRAMQIIDELEPVRRGPYTGALGYIGFNRESQLSIMIRAAICKNGAAHFNVGAGIVADSNPEMEFAETMAKAGGFIASFNGAIRTAVVVPSC